MELFVALGRAAGLSLAAGLNLYATLAAVGLAVRFDLVELPAAYDPLGSNLALAVFLGLYVIEFLADKIPWLDTAWDLVHTLVRPLGGAFLAIAALGPSSPELDVVAGLVGATIAGTSHFTKASTRVAANTTMIPGPGIVLSVAEDALAMALAALVVFVPLLALLVTVILLVLFVRFLLAVRRRVKRRRAS